MPSPIGHLLASLAVGGPGRYGRDGVVRAGVAVGIGLAPDLDLLWGRHSGETHSAGAALLAGTFAFVLLKALEVRTANPRRSHEPSTFVRTPEVRTIPQSSYEPLHTALLVCAVWLAHPLLDCLGEDSSAPFGVMLWWPFSREFVIAPFHIFDSAYRAYWKPDFWPHNIVAVTKEVLILGPLAAGAWFWRRRQ